MIAPLIVAGGMLLIALWCYWTSARTAVVKTDDSLRRQLIERVAGIFVDWYPSDARPMHRNAWLCLAAQEPIVRMFMRSASDDDWAEVFLRIDEIRTGLDAADRMIADALKGLK